MINEQTKKIIKNLPYWFQAKHLNEESTTRDFLNMFGELLEESNNRISSAYKNCDLETFDNKDHIVHKIFIDSYEMITINNVPAIYFISEQEFVNSIGLDIHGYYYDATHNILYISNFKNTDTIQIDGIEYNSLIIEHRIWNGDIIDEFGLLYDMPRLKKENNLNYKDRLLEYSRTPANSTLHGVCSYIGHFTGKYKIIEWVDASKDVKLHDDVICSFVFVDDKPFFNVDVIDNNTLVLKGDLGLKGVSRKIKYFYMFDVETLTGYFKDNDTYYSNFVPDESFQKLFNEISIKCPIMWGTSRWDEHYWLNDIKNDEYFFISPTFDPDISVLKK